MCGRFTYNLTWEQIVALHRLTLDAQPRNPQPRFNIPPTATIDAVLSLDGKRVLVRQQRARSPCALARHDSRASAVIPGRGRSPRVRSRRSSARWWSNTEHRHSRGASQKYKGGWLFVQDLRPAIVRDQIDDAFNARI
jgi:putative SOS response-associated peptidase YedK